MPLSPIIIDFEATCLPAAGSWPIEVALGWPDTGEVRAWLIRPDVAWLKDWRWSAASEGVHNITRAQLDRDGAPVSVARFFELASGESYSAIKTLTQELSAPVAVIPIATSLGAVMRPNQSRRRQGPNLLSTLDQTGPRNT